VPSDFDVQSIKTDTQADRIEREVGYAMIYRIQPATLTHTFRVQEKDKELAAERKAAEAKEKAKQAKDKAKEKAKIGANKAEKNIDNPVIIGNAIAVGALGTLLGVGAYKKYTAGELSWKVVGAWTGVVGLFAAADYFVSG